MRNPKLQTLEELRNASVYEPKVVAFLELQRWGDDSCCTRCGYTDVYQMKTNGQRNKDYRWRFEGGHEVVKYGAKECVRLGTDVHSNSMEDVFSLIQREIMGTFLSVSRKHLPNYLNEFQFRWNIRKLDGGQRVSRVVKALEGKRLEYRQSVGNPPYSAA